MNETLLKPIVELAYLNAQNVDRYRCIMRYFYDQHQRLRARSEGVKIREELTRVRMGKAVLELEKLKGEHPKVKGAGGVGSKIKLTAVHARLTR